MDSTLYLLLQKPLYQALLFLVLTPILIAVLQPKNAEHAWSIAAYVFGVFLIANAVLLWFDDSPWRYFFYSIACALGYVLLMAIDADVNPFVTTGKPGGKCYGFFDYHLPACSVAGRDAG